jgi:hypothetical protein
MSPTASEGRQRDLIGAWLDAPIEAGPLAVPPFDRQHRKKGDVLIVVGVDPHKATNTAVALVAGTGQLRDEPLLVRNRRTSIE